MPALDLLPPVRELSFVEDGHRYEYASRWGTLRPLSVSGILTATGAKAMNYSAWRRSLMAKKGLDEAQADQYMEDHRKARAMIGTIFHGLVQSCLQPDVKIDTVQVESEAMFCAWEKKFLPRIEVVRLVEQPLIHKSCYYVGTPDLLAVIDGKLTLVDWKTCQAGKARVRPEWLLQQAAYAQLIKSCYGIDVHHGMNVVVWAGDLLVQPWNAADLRYGWATFVGYLMEYHSRQASLGDWASHAALTAMEPMFKAA